ncbi:hypothetical protein K6119_02655 [Paracrocinitomix mangrovi]|uniref:hypothetical protein n=1 Tax=Paracrocinitomix mangrovi TaxID=2862509 RepID=UPI001C8DD37A|nr:hypothetical protein [Paracrocinitomix mangrovi]UKN02420.1 hypothetical protein K6119_02655 [Paracrocinitomix mangrovi]
MKKIIYTAALLMLVGISTSCKKGTCTCTVLGSEISTKVTADDHDEYKDAKASCENAGCKWSPGH